MAAGKMIMSFFLVVVLLVGLMAVFTVKETELALMLRLGKVVSGDFDPGLHFKLPFVIQIRKFDKRIQTLDAPPEHFLTSEKKNLIVDSFIKWRIVDVENYFTAVGGNPQRAGRRLAEVIADGLRSEFGKRTIQEVVSGDRAEIMDIITEEASARATKFGISIIDVRIKRIELPPEVSTSVYRRMEAERERDAKQLRSQGEAQAVRIRAEADRKSVEMVAKAERDAEQIRGEGDGKATNIYAQAYTQNAEFYALYRSLNAYKSAFSNRSDMLLIQPDSDFFSYFNNLHGNNSKVPAAVPVEKLAESTSQLKEVKTSPQEETASEVEVNISVEGTASKETEVNTSQNENSTEEKEVNVPQEETASEVKEVDIPQEETASTETEVNTSQDESSTEEKPVNVSQEETASKETEVNTSQDESSTEEKPVNVPQEETASEVKEVKTSQDETSSEDKEVKIPQSEEPEKKEANID